MSLQISCVSERRILSGCHMTATRVFPLLPRPAALFRSGLVLTLGCANGSDVGSVDPPPVYSWRGIIVDSTGTTQTGITLAVDERDAHVAAGWRPGFDVSPTAQGGFFAAYAFDSFQCLSATDTVLTLTLRFTDSSGELPPTSHVSQWHLDCDGEREPADSVGFPAEDSLVIRLE
jgi:hypothetical protein